MSFKVFKSDLQLRPKEAAIHGRLCVFHHRACTPGYISRQSNGPVITRYSGRFGEGYTVDFPRWDTTRYVWREYWIFED